MESQSVAAMEKGSKKKNQDRFLIHRFTKEEKKEGEEKEEEQEKKEKEKEEKKEEKKKEEEEEEEVLLGVFDGHGDYGEEVAEFIKESFRRNLYASAYEGLQSSESSSSSSVDIRTALKNPDIEISTGAMKHLFQVVSNDLLSSSAIDCYISGTTVCIAHIFHSRLIVASLGDTRAILASYPEGSASSASSEQTLKPPRANVITRDHTCQDEQEKARIIEAGGRVDSLFEDGKPQGPLRIFKGTLPYPGLVVTRSLGDDVAHKVGVTSEPEITPIDLIAEDAYLLIATDGLWDLLSPKQVVKFLQKYEKLDEGCKELVAHAMGISDGDNTTVLIHRFRQSPKTESLSTGLDALKLGN